MGTRSPGHVIRDIVGVTVSRDQSRFPFGLSVGSTCFAADESGRGSAQSAQSQYGLMSDLASECSKVLIVRKTSFYFFSSVAGGAATGGAGAGELAKTVNVLSGASVKIVRI